MRIINNSEIVSCLTYEACIPLVREAMISLSTGHAARTLRSVIKMDENKVFGVMPGTLDRPEKVFGAKLLGVFTDANAHQRHHGIIALFDGEDGQPICIADAECVTAIRTAAASAVAVEALARPDARRLAILGCGTQARAHIHALTCARTYEAITVWGRDPAKARAFAAKLSEEAGVPIAVAETAEQAARTSDVICTVTTSATPILFNGWIAPGTHINAVGSSIPGPSEIDEQLVLHSRYFADNRLSALEQGAEFLNAKAAGLICDDHILGEIGEVLAGTIAGRRSASEITLYKSLGHIVQDLAAISYVARVS